MEGAAPGFPPLGRWVLVIGECQPTFELTLLESTGQVIYSFPQVVSGKPVAAKVFLTPS